MSVPSTVRSELEALMRARLDRECVYVPSCRFALYLALRRWCPPGGRVLMSPVNDDVILFVVLAAGLRPVLAPVSPRDGTIDPDAVPEVVWRGLSAVLTTNLYGMPDRAGELGARCAALGIPLIEDAAHAIGSEVAGRPVGTFGTASVFSMSKHVGAGGGGFLAVADPAERKAAEEFRDALLAPRRLSRETAQALRPLARSAVGRARLGYPAWRTLRALGLLERDGYRMDLRRPELITAVARTPALHALHDWIRLDLHGYGLRHGTAFQRTVHRRLTRLPQNLARRRQGTHRLAATPWAAPGVQAVAGPGTAPRDAPALFRVPLMVRDRDAVLDRLRRHGVITGYVYDPPLDDFAGPEFVDPSPAPGAARWFARHVLPVDPLRAVRAVRLLYGLGAEAVGRDQAEGVPRRRTR